MQSQIAKVCANDGITPLRVEDLANILEFFPLEGLNPLALRALFDLHTPGETQDWVARLQERVQVPKPRIDTLIDVIVDYSDTKEPTNLDRLLGYMNTMGWDERLEDLEGLVRGLQALAPNSFYFDGSTIALNATPQILFEEIRKTLEGYTNPDVVAPYLTSIPVSPCR